MIRKRLVIPFLCCAFHLLMLLGCSSTPIVKESLPSIVRAHKELTFYRGGSDEKDTGIQVREGDIYSILPSLNHLMGLIRYRIGSEEISMTASFHNQVDSSGTLYLAYTLWPYYSTVTHFSVDVIVWEKEDWSQISDFLGQLKEKDPTYDSVIDAHREARSRKQIFLAEAEASRSIQETKKKLEEL